MNKSDILQELSNVFPSWSKIRKDDQSVGQLALNSIANPIEKMERQLATVRDNQYLTTANLNEMDLTFIVELDPDFVFDEDNTDPLISCPIAPTVTGLMTSQWYDVRIAPNLDILSFWYDSVPDRISLAEITSGVNESVLVMDADESPVSGVFSHHLTNGGYMYLESVGGVEYLSLEENSIKRGKVILSGKTRKGTIEEETMIFAWDQKQKTLKEWKEIHSISAFDIEDSVELELTSADFNGPYISPWNLKYSIERNKIDEFYDVGHNGSIPTLDRIEYISDEWQQLILGFSSKDVKESWELLTDTTEIVSGINVTVSGVDMTFEPYTNRVWVAETDTIYCYDLTDKTVSGVNLLKDSTPGSQVQLDYDFDKVILGDSIQFFPWHSRPLKEIQEYRIWYQEPNGNKYGLLDGASVSITSNHAKILELGTPITRSIENFIDIPTTQRGEYLIVIETTFVDGTKEEYRRIFSVRYKTPLRTIDTSSIIPEPLTGIDFDSDQKLWVRTATGHYRLNLHTDIMLIDYQSKVIYFKEEYDQVGIKTNG